MPRIVFDDTDEHNGDESSEGGGDTSTVEEKTLLGKREKAVENPEDTVAKDAFKKVVAQVNTEFEDVNQAITTLQDTLKDENKTQVERIETIEKGLKDLKEIAQKTKSVSPWSEEVSGDILFKGIGESTPQQVVVDTLNTAYESPTDSEVIKEWQEWATRIKVLSQCLKVEPEELQTYKEYEAFLEKTGLAKIVNLTGAPTNFIPEGWSDMIQQQFYQRLEVVQMFPDYTMPRNPHHWDILGRAEAVRWTERTANNADRGDGAPTPQNPSQGAVTFNASVMMVPILITAEFAEDALNEYIPTLTEQMMPSGLAQGLEKAVINGDVRGTHQDNAEPTNSVARNFDGLRRIALERSADTPPPLVNGATYNFGIFTSMLRAGGIYTVHPRDGAWIFSNSTYTQAFDFGAIQTMDKTAMPTNTEGAIGMLLGRPVYVSGEFPTDLDSTGVRSGTPANNTKTGLLHVNRDLFRLGKRRMTSVSMEYDNLLQSWIIVATNRCDFKAMEHRRSGFTPAVMARNITSFA